MADNFINRVNNIFPIDYLTSDELTQIVDDFVSEMIKLVQKKDPKERKQEQKKVLGWKTSLSEDKLEDIILDDNETNELRKTIGIFLSERVGKQVSLDQISEYQLLVQKNYPYLYLVHGYVPLVFEETSIKSLIIDEDDFFRYCFSLNVFDRNDTELTIENKFKNNFDEYLDNFIYCIEEMNNLNIVCLSQDKFGQVGSSVFKSSLSEKRFLLERKTQFYFYEKGNWYSIKYFSLISNEMSFYDQINTKFSDVRLKRLLSIENERVSLDKLVVKYEPTDIGRKLPVIKINVDGKSIKLLVGSTYNLYLYSNEDIINETNIIVGKLDVININQDDKTGKANIRWIEGYQELLLKK